MSELRCLVSPWMPNGTLTIYLKSNHDDLTVLDRSRMLEDVSAGLHYLHSMRIIHGDITGANILIDEEGHARLIDFGLSTIIQPLLGQSDLAATSIRPGALGYAAPELFLSDDVSDPELVKKIDIYSFGCVMLQILSGRPPWSEIKSKNQHFRIPLMISEGRGPQCPDGHPKIIDFNWNFIQKCLQFEPKLRPSVDEALDFVVHKFHTSDSCGRPSDDPSDEMQSNFHGASLDGSSGDPDVVEQTSDSPPLPSGHEANPLTILECKIQESSHVRPPIQQFRLGSVRLARMVLNNMLQWRYGPSAPSHVKWEIYSQGPEQSLTWYATVYIDDNNHGHGTANTKVGAQEIAAIQAIEWLDKERE